MDMNIDLKRTALVWSILRWIFLIRMASLRALSATSVTKQGVVDNLERLFVTAKQVDMPVVVSPYYYCPQEHHWRFESSGADWMPQYKP